MVQLISMMGHFLRCGSCLYITYVHLSLKFRFYFILRPFVKKSALFDFYIIKIIILEVIREEIFLVLYVIFVYNKGRILQ